MGGGGSCKRDWFERDYKEASCGEDEDVGKNWWFGRNRCYPQCHDGFTKRGNMCEAQCPKGTHDCGRVCLPDGTKCGSIFTSSVLNLFKAGNKLRKVDTTNLDTVKETMSHAKDAGEDLKEFGKVFQLDYCEPLPQEVKDKYGYK